MQLQSSERRFARLGNGGRTLACILLMSAIMGVGSERIFWFWSSDPLAHIEVAIFYGLATGSAWVLMRRFQVSSWWSLALVYPILAFVVEGVITPVIYSGGPMVPLFPAWFTMWHGVLSFGLLVVAVRNWLLQHRWRPLLGTAVLTGMFWAVWATTLRLPENVEDEELVSDLGELVVLGPGAFTVYASIFAAIAMLAHLGLGLVWPAEVMEPPRHRGLTTGEWLLVAVTVIAVGTWTLVVPWAAPMFGIYCWIQIKGLRWHRSVVARSAQSSLLSQLSGRVRVREVLWLAPMAPVAAGGYALLWHLDPSESAIRVTMYSIIAIQAVAGAWISVSALRRAHLAHRNHTNANNTTDLLALA